MLSHLEEEPLVFGDGHKDFIYVFVIVVPQSLACLDLAHGVLFQQELKQPVLLGLTDLNFANIFIFRVNSDPKNGTVILFTINVLDVKQALCLPLLYLWVFLPFIVCHAEPPLVIVLQKLPTSFNFGH